MHCNWELRAQWLAMKMKVLCCDRENECYSVPEWSLTYGVLHNSLILHAPLWVRELGCVRYWAQCWCWHQKWWNRVFVCWPAGGISLLLSFCSHAANRQSTCLWSCSVDNVSPFPACHFYQWQPSEEPLVAAEKDCSKDQRQIKAARVCPHRSCISIWLTHQTNKQINKSDKQKLLYTVHCSCIVSSIITLFKITLMLGHYFSWWQKILSKAIYWFTKTNLFNLTKATDMCIHYIYIEFNIIFIYRFIFLRWCLMKVLSYIFISSMLQGILIEQ